MRQRQLSEKGKRMSRKRDTATLGEPWGEGRDTRESELHSQFGPTLVFPALQKFIQKMFASYLKGRTSQFVRKKNGVRGCVLQGEKNTSSLIVAVRASRA